MINNNFNLFPAFDIGYCFKTLKMPRYNCFDNIKHCLNDYIIFANRYECHDKKYLSRIQLLPKII